MNKKNSEIELSRDEIRFQAAIKFVDNATNFKILYDLLENSRYAGKKVSIRTLEWFVVNYSETNDISYNLEEAKTTSSEMFQVNKSYQDQLRIYTKKSFDPFCRKGSSAEKVHTFNKKFHGGKKSVTLSIATNLAQMNFFMWAIGNRVLDYIVDNYEEIMQAKKIAERQRRKAKGARKVLDTSSSDSEDAKASGSRDEGDSDADTEHASTLRRETKGSRRKRQGAVVVRHFTGGITVAM